MAHRVQRRRGPEGQKRILLLGGIVVVGLLVAFAVVIRRNQDDARHALAGRFESRAELTSAFVHDYLADVAAHEDTPDGGPPDDTTGTAARLEVDGTPLEAFLRSVVPTYGGNALLVDDDGELIADGSGAVPASPELRQLAPGLHQITIDGRDVTVSVVRVEGAPWRTILVGDTTGLYATVSNGQWAPWLLWGTLAIVLIATLWLGLRLNRARSDAADIARTDELTHLPNRRSMIEALERQVAQTMRSSGEMVLLLLDVDHFKSVNDQNGHTAGDEALRVVADAIGRALRAGDLVGRWGGEEFLVVLAPTTPDGATEVAERIRATVEATSMTFLSAGQCTVSIGLAPVVDGDVDVALTAADTALYRAKAEGRNCVRVASR